MSFAEIRANYPDTVCDCGHSAAVHLYCSDHVCVGAGCFCEGFSLAEEIRLGQTKGGTVVVLGIFPGNRIGKSVGKKKKGSARGKESCPNLISRIGN